MNLKALFATGSLILEGVVFAQEEVGVDGRAASADVEELEDVVLGKKEMLPSSGLMTALSELEGISVSDGLTVSDCEFMFKFYVYGLKGDSTMVKATFVTYDGSVICDPISFRFGWWSSDHLCIEWYSDDDFYDFSGSIAYIDIRAKSEAVGEYLIDHATWWWETKIVFRWGRENENAWCISNNPNGWEKYTYDCNCSGSLWWRECETCYNVISKKCRKGYRFIMGNEYPQALD